MESLPDLPNIECFYLSEITEEVLTQLMCEFQCLNIIYGLPHEEVLSRYMDGIMYYDEVMSFTYMFADCREFGKQNSETKFFVMDGYFGELGLFSKIETCARYVKSKGKNPVICLRKSGSSFYSD